MPNLEVSDVNLHYIDTGGEKEPIVFSHGFLMSGEMFRDQIEYLKDKYRVIAYDHRGQGQSEVTDNGYHIDNLTKDTKLLIEKLQIEPVSFVGLSTGGFVGMRLASRYPNLIKRLILMETSAEAESRSNKIQYWFLSIVVRVFGLKLVVKTIMKKLFGKTFMKSPDFNEKRKEWKSFILKRNVPGAIRSMRNAVRRDSVVDEITKIDCPTLILVGEEDKPTPLKKAELINKQINNSELKTIPKAGHSSPIEQPEFVSNVIEEFLNKK